MIYKGIDGYVQDNDVWSCVDRRNQRTMIPRRMNVDIVYLTTTRPRLRTSLRRCCRPGRLTLRADPPPHGTLLAARLRLRPLSSTTRHRVPPQQWRQTVTSVRSGSRMKSCHVTSRLPLLNRLVTPVYRAMSNVVCLLRAIDRFALPIDRVALLDDRSFVAQSTDRAKMTFTKT